MRNKEVIIVPSVLGVALSLCFGLGGGCQQPISLEQKTAKAELIVVGKVIDIESKWDEKKSNIFTYVSFSLEETVKGRTTKKDITIRILGGGVGTIGAIVEGMPSVRQGERALVFLERGLCSDYFILVHGAYTWYPISQKNTVTSGLVPLPEFIDKIRRYLPKEE